MVIIRFPRLGKIYFGGLLGGKNLWKTNIQNRWHKLEWWEKWLSSALFEHIRAWHSRFMCGRNSASIRDSKTAKSFYYVFSLLTSKQENNYLRFLENIIIIELLLWCTEWLGSRFLYLLRRKKWSYSAGKMYSYELLFPRLTEILVRKPRLSGETFIPYELNFLFVKARIMPTFHWNYFPLQSR